MRALIRSTIVLLLCISASVTSEPSYAAPGTSVEQDAEHGDADSQTTLGVLYRDGRGVPQDYAAAVSWFHKAANQGFLESQFYLGMMYESGKGVPKDLVLAHKWFNLAAAHVPSTQAQYEQRAVAVDMREFVEEKMTPAQIAEAQKLAREWKPKTSGQ